MTHRSTRVLVARHGETEDNAAGRWQGWNDSALTARGLAQAAALRRRLAPERLAAVYSSDLERAAHTARIAAAPHGLTPWLDPAWRERNAGLFAGLTGPELEARYPVAFERRRATARGLQHRMGPAARYAAVVAGQNAENNKTHPGPIDWAPPEGESLRQVLSRVLPALDRIAAEWLDRTVLLVTHGGVVRLLASYGSGGDWERLWERHPSNCGLSSFTWHGAGMLTLEQCDEHSFLDEQGVPPFAADVAH